MSADNTSILLDNAVVWAGPCPRPSHRWLVIRDNRVAETGTGQPPATDRRVDLGGLHVLPGFVDAHSHLTVSAWLPHAMDASAWRSLDDTISAVARHRTARPPGTWLVAMAADFDQIRGPLPRADDLEAASGGRPVIIADFSLHRSLVSHGALRLLNEGSPRFAGDIDRRRGRPTGMIWESAHAAAFGLAMRSLAQELGDHGHDALLDCEALRHLSVGITACHDPCVPIDMQGRLESLRRRTPLRLSWSSVSRGGILDPATEQELCPSCGEGPRSAKLFMDGAHRCALCLDPGHVVRMTGHALSHALRGHLAPIREVMAHRSVYRQGRIHMPYLRMETPELTSRIDALARHGVRPRIHAVGNHAARCACAALNATGCRSATLEHLTFLDDHDIEAVARSEAIAAMQPGFIGRFGADILDRGMTPRLKAYPLKSLQHAGVAVALSSDNPCGPLDPLANIRTAMTRQCPDGRAVDAAEALTLEEAVAAATVGGHHAIHGSPGAGLIEGATADLAIVSGDMLAGTAKVAETWIDGRRVWSATTPWHGSTAWQNGG
jgi:predicted amidohydrolase YtcJ